MRRAGLLMALPPSKKAFANLHNVNGEVIFRVHFQTTCFLLCFFNYREVLWIRNTGSGTSTVRPDNGRVNKAARLQDSLGCHLCLHTAIPPQEKRMCRTRHKSFNSVERQSSIEQTNKQNKQKQILRARVWLCDSKAEYAVSSLCVWVDVSMCEGEGECEGVCVWMNVSIGRGVWACVSLSMCVRVWANVSVCEGVCSGRAVRQYKKKQQTARKRTAWWYYSTSDRADQVLSVKHWKDRPKDPANQDGWPSANKLSILGHQEILTQWADVSVTDKTSR